MNVLAVLLVAAVAWALFREWTSRAWRHEAQIAGRQVDRLLVMVGYFVKQPRDARGRFVRREDV